MNITSSNQAHVYKNVMETLVNNELDRQLKDLPPKLADYLNRVEVITYALNRLPALYATSEKGWHRQQLRGTSELRNQISTAVRQALVAVRRDPLRATTPLKPEEDQEIQVALQRLRRMLKRDNLSWRNLVDMVEQMVIRSAKRGSNPEQKRGSTPEQKHRSSSPGYGWNDSYYNR